MKNLTNCIRVASFIALGASVRSQPAPETPAPPTPSPAATEFATRPREHSSVFESSGFDLSDWRPLKQIGPVFLGADVSYAHSWQSRAPSAQGSRGDTQMDEISPDIRARYLDLFSLSYQPSWVNYSSSLYRDHIRHRFTLSSSFHVGRVHTSLSQSYDRNESSDLETGQQTLRESWRTKAVVATPIAHGVSIEYEGGVAARALPHVRMVRDWSNGIFARYSVRKNASARLGYINTYTDVKPGPNAVRDEVRLQATWVPTLRTRFLAKIGHETRRYKVTNGESNSALKYSLEGTYALGSRTTLEASVERGSDTSPAVNRERDRFSWDAGVTYVLPYNYLLRADFRKVDADYKDLRSITTRSDSSEHVTVTLMVPVSRRIVVSAFSAWTKNTSSQAQFSVDSAQYGIRFRYEF